MIERPEAILLASQLDQTLRGRRITAAERENSPHKWVFYSRPREEYQTIPRGKRIGEVTSAGSCIIVPLTPGYFVLLGDGGERIALLEPDDALPTKYHLLWTFDDDRRLAVSVQGWGAAKLLDRKQYNKWRKQEDEGVDPASDAFTLERFTQLVEDYAASCDKPLKAMLVNQPQIRGIGNGYLQDILHRARLHPARKVRQTTAAQRKKLFQAIRAVLKEAIKKRGRDDELDLYGHAGRYIRKMDKRTANTPCPNCGTSIKKISYMGGSCYVCPKCQPMD